MSGEHETGGIVWRSIRERPSLSVGERNPHLDAEKIKSSIGAPHIAIGGVEESKSKETAALVDLGDKSQIK